MTTMVGEMAQTGRCELALAAHTMSDDHDTKPMEFVRLLGKIESLLGKCGVS